MLTTALLALSLGLTPAGPAPAPAGWMPVQTADGASRAVQPEGGYLDSTLQMRAFVRGFEVPAVERARLGRLAPTRFEFTGSAAGRVTLLGQLLEPGQLPDGQAQGLQLDPGLAAILGEGWLAQDGTLHLDLPPASALPLGSRLMVQGHLGGGASGGSSPADQGFTRPLVLELVDQRTYDLRAGLAGWGVTPELTAVVDPKAPAADLAWAHLDGSGLHLGPRTSVELRRALRGLSPDSDVELRIELRGSHGDQAPLSPRSLGLSVLSKGEEPPVRLSLDLSAGGGLQGVLRARADAGGRVHVELLLESGERPFDLSALVLTLR